MNDLPSETAGGRRARVSPRRSGRRRWLAVGLVSVALAAGLVWRLGFYRPARLNVVLITLDTTRADYLGCYGQSGARTPTLDRLARDGVLFGHCTTSCSLTLPAHVSIMTGAYPFVHGARQNGTYRVAEANETLAEAFHAAGYATKATIAVSVLNRPYGLDQGFEEYHDVPPKSGADEGYVERPGDEVCTDALALLRKAAPGPFFLWVHFYDPHFPYISHGGDATERTALYQGEIDFVDLQVGRLIDAVRDLGLEQQTLVIVVADHGEGLGQHGESYHSYFTHETTLHVPLICAWPGRIPAGRRVEAQVRTVDIAPTVLELAGVARLRQSQGVSLAPLLTGSATDLSLSAYAESLEAYFHFGLSPLRSLTAGGWKYVLAPAPELYHLAVDPGEQQDVISESPEIAAKLRAQLYSLVTEAPPPPPIEETIPAVGAADLIRLQSLGYTGGRSAESDPGTNEIALLDPRGEDPKDHVPVIDAYAQTVWTRDRGEFAQTEALLRQTIAAFPNAPHPRGDLAQILEIMERWDDALEECRQALALAPQDQVLQWRFAEVLLKAHRWTEAVDHLTAFLEQHPDDFEARYNLGVALASLRRFDEARGHLERALKENPRHPDALHALGLVCLETRQYREARDYFTKALEIDPSHAKARRDLERVQRIVGKP